MLRILLAICLSVVVAGSALAAKDPTKGKGDKNAFKFIKAATDANEKKEWDTVILNADKTLAVKDVGTGLQYIAHQLRVVAHLQKDPKTACQAVMPDLQFVTTADQMVLKEKPDAEKAANAAEFLSLQGKCMAELKVGDKGLASYTTAIAADPQNWSYYQGRCFVYYESDQNEKAIEDCQKAAMLNQTDVQSLKVIASAYHKMGKKKEALEAWEAVLEAAPGDEMAKKNIDGLKKAAAKP